MKYLVTGGSGFIGTNLIDLLISKNYNVLNIDINKPQNIKHNKYWIKCNICDFDKLKKEILNYKPDFIIHLSAKTDLLGKTLNDYSANIEGVENIMNISEEVKNLRKIIIGSSMLVCKLGYHPKDFDDYKPNTLYGESKVLTEKIVRRYRIPWIIIRPTSIWGPWFGEPYKKFFNLVIKGIYFNIDKNYSATKTFGYVKNTSNQILDLCLSKNSKLNHNYYYLGDKTPLNITNWANKIRALSNKKKLIYVNKNIFKGMCYLGDFFYKYFKINTPLNSFRYKNMTTDNIMDLTRLNKFYDDSKEMGLDNNISETINWLQNN